MVNYLVICLNCIMNLNIRHRLRRNRSSAEIRNLVAETKLHIHDFVFPIFIHDGSESQIPIKSLPGSFRYSIKGVKVICKKLVDSNIKACVLFPAINASKKTKNATEALNPDSLICQAVHIIKQNFPSLLVFTDIALDPYSSDGHDGIVINGSVINDETVDILAKMAVLHAKAGADFVTPSDMMDGRVGAIRSSLDLASFMNVGIISYSAKYVSSFYSPFRDALDSEPKMGDKKTYQMDIANRKEAIREAELDLQEGADIIMVKPAGFFLDIIRDFKNHFNCPIAAYHVSGEYAMIKCAARHGLVDEKDALLEASIAIKRAGADIIFSYAALELAKMI